MSRQVGLKDIVVALLTSDGSTAAVYEAPQKLERAIKATLKPKVSDDKKYSDDGIEEIVHNFDSIEVSIELNQLSLDSRALLQGSKVIKGVLIESKDDIPPTLALGFKSRKTNGKYRYVWLYKGSFSMGDDNYETSADKLKDQTASLTGTFYARDFDGKYRLICDEDSTSVDSTVFTTFFDTVIVPPTGSTTTTLTVTAGMSAIVTSIVGTVVTAATGKTVAQLKSALQVDSGKGSLKVYATSAKATYALDAATVVNTMVIEATAQDSTTKATSTIVVA